MERFRSIGATHGVVLLPVKVAVTLKGYDGEAALRDAGVLFHQPLADYPKLRFAELPPGWKVVEIEGSRGEKSNLLDDKNRVRATMRHFYGFTGAISMRRTGIRATMIVACPFIISFRGERKGELVARIRIRHGGEIKAMPPIPFPYGSNPGEVKAEQLAFMYQWLDEAHPKWRSSARHWDLQAAA